VNLRHPATGAAWPGAGRAAITWAGMSQQTAIIEFLRWRFQPLFATAFAVIGNNPPAGWSTRFCGRERRCQSLVSGAPEALRGMGWPRFAEIGRAGKR